MSLPPVDCQFANSYGNEQPLPPIVQSNAVTQVPPAKKITFYKSGDPQFTGIKMAINQRSFKSFNGLMDDLSHRIPLPFGVRAITTPRGIHFINTLDQLEDGGCYLCSDKKYVTPLNTGVANRKLGPQKIRQSASVLKSIAQDIKQEDHSMASTQQSPRIPKKITLIKNGDITTQLPIILNRRNAQSFKILLDEISEIMQFTVRKLYTIDGKRIDSLQGLLLCPNMLICVGQEPFKPIIMQNPKKHSSEKLPGLASHSNSNSLGKKNGMNFGLKAKKSVIHPRSSLSNRSMRFSLSSEKSYINGPATTPENGISSSNDCPKGEDLVPSLVNDDIEKKVYMNKDGSLSVEMKVCFHLLSDETLQWSTQIKKSSLMNQTLCEESDIIVDNQSEPRQKISQESSFEDSLYPCDADSYISNLDESENEVTYCHCCSKSHSNYDIWKNPMHVSQKEEPGVTNTWYTHSSCSSSSSHQRMVHKKRASTDRIHTSSNEKQHPEHIVQETSDFSETLGNNMENGRIKDCCCQGNYIQTSRSQKEVPKKMVSAASLTCSENENGSIARRERDESKGSRARSNKSKCQYSIESQIEVLEEASSVIRTISSCSIKEREEVIGCSSSPNSACSKCSKCSTFGKKDKVEKISDIDYISSHNKISSFSSDDCPPKIVTQVDVEKEDEDNNEINSVSEKIVAKSLIKGEVNKCSKKSKNRVFQSKVYNEEDRRSDIGEMDVYSVALSASRIFNRIKRNQNVSKGDSKVSSGSSRVSAIKKKEAKGPLPVEDERLSSRRTSSSEKSNEVGKRDKGDQLSHNSSHSNVSPLSEAAVNTEENPSRISKCHRKSSRNSHKRTQIEDTEVSPPVSNVIESEEKNGADTANISTQENTSKQGSSSESVCSKCGHKAETTSSSLWCASSKNLLHSDAKSTCSEMQVSENNDISSQSSIAQSSKPSQKKRSNVNLKYCSQVSEKASTTQFNFHVPVPPRGRPSSKNSRSLLVNINSAPVSIELEPTADELQKEMAGSQLPETDTANEAKEKEASGHEKKQIKEEATVQTEATSETYDQIIPSLLPNASPEEVVHEWLRKIPSESLLMKCEMEKDEEKIEVHAEVPSCSNNPDLLQEECNETEDMEDCEQLTEKEYPQEEKASESISEETETSQGECQHSGIHSQNNHQKHLPHTVQISVQIMKALLASKHESKLDRSYSLPEVSPTLGKKLSNSANILLQCLATLQLLDEEVDPSNKQNKCLNWFRYKELFNIFHAVWFGNIFENRNINLGLQGKGQIKPSSSFKDPNSKHGDFATMTSSGIDVSSGDGGSGEESGVGTHDSALLKEKRDKTKFPEEGKPERKDGNEEEPEEHSQPLCSKFESESQPEVTGVQKVIEAKEEQDHENTNDLDKNSIHGDQNVDDAENVSNADNILMETHTDTMAKELEKNPSEESGNNETEPDSSVNDEKAAKIHSENQSVKVSPMMQQRSSSQDPVWVLKLLKKIEKEFMTHYVSAMNEFKVKWNLSDSEELDLMIAELKEEVSRRIQKSVEEELNKIKSRTGKKVPKPPENELRHNSTPELENRRRRLTSMLSLNNISDQSTNSNKQLESRDLSYDSDKDGFFHNTIQEDRRYDDQLKDGEYCPCEMCMTKKMVAKTAQHTVVVMAKTPNPVLKAFDLQEILRMKNTRVDHRKTEYDISEPGQEEEAQQAAKISVECDGEQEAKYEEGQEEEQEEEQEKDQEEGQEEQEQEERMEEEQEEKDQEEGQEEGQEEEQEEQEQEEGQEEEQEEGQEEEQEEGQEQQEENQEEEQKEEQEKKEEAEEQEEKQKEQQEEQEQEEEREEEQEEQEQEDEEQEGLEGQAQEQEEQEQEEEREEEQEEQKQEDEEQEGLEGQAQEQEEQEQKESQEEREEQVEGQEQEEKQEQEEEQQEGQDEEEEEQQEKQGEEQEEKQKEGQEEQEQEEEEQVLEQEEGQQEEHKEEQEEQQEKEEGQQEEQEEEVQQKEQEEGQQEQEQEEVQEQEKEQEESMKGEEEENEEQENPNTEDEEKEGESVKEDEKVEAAKQEDEEKSEKESVNEKEEEEEKETEEDITLAESKEGKEDGEQGGKNVIYEENDQEIEAKSRGDKELNDEEEMDEEQKETPKDDQETEDEPNVTDNSPEAEEEDENKEGDEAGENEADGDDSSISAQNPEDDGGTEENGATDASEKGSEGIFSQQSQEGSECRSEEDESKKKENISKEDGDCGSDGETKLVKESKSAKMYPDSNEEEEDDQSSQASIVTGEDPPNEDKEDSHRVSKKKKQSSNAIDQDDLDF